MFQGTVYIFSCLSFTRFACDSAQHVSRCFSSPLSSQPDTLIKPNRVTVNSVLRVAQRRHCRPQITAETSLILGMTAAFCLAPFLVVGVQVGAGDVVRRVNDATLADKLAYRTGNVVQLAQQVGGAFGLDESAAVAQADPAVNGPVQDAGQLGEQLVAQGMIFSAVKALPQSQEQHAAGQRSRRIA